MCFSCFCFCRRVYASIFGFQQGMLRTFVEKKRILFIDHLYIQVADVGQLGIWSVFCIGLADGRNDVRMRRSAIVRGEIHLTIPR